MLLFKPHAKQYACDDALVGSSRSGTWRLARIRTRAMVIGWPRNVATPRGDKGATKATRCLGTHFLNRRFVCFSNLAFI